VSKTTAADTLDRLHKTNDQFDCDWYDGKPCNCGVSEAAKDLYEAFLNVIGKDEKTNPKHKDSEWGEGYDCVVCEARHRKNQLRAEQRKLLRKFFNVDEEKT